MAREESVGVIAAAGGGRIGTVTLETVGADVTAGTAGGRGRGFSRVVIGEIAAVTRGRGARCDRVVHCTLRSALESDSRCTRCPAVVAMRFHFSFSLSPWMWQPAQTRVGTLECILIFSGRSATQRYNCRVLAKLDCW